jgi:hypothetical protein
VKAPAWVRSVRWGRPVRRADGVGHVTVTLDVDTRPFDESIRRAVLALEQLKWRQIVLHEQASVRRWWGEQAQAMWGRSAAHLRRAGGAAEEPGGPDAGRARGAQLGRAITLGLGGVTAP